MELILYIIIGIIWLIVSLIQKAAKGNSKKVNRQKTINKKVNTNNRKSYDNDDEIYRNLRKSINELKNINEDDDFYDDEYKSASEILEEQNRYASKIREIESIKSNIEEAASSFNVVDNKRHVNHMLTSLDIKNAIIYNAILEPKRINYYRKIKREINK
ncbi:hypothetical protein [Brachyspira pilosicoli]|uniref:Uncharacterized protein n=1 Tax=Brachyspira pilosicoli TaxID=52584 RepID=A0A5C8F5G1_BRAPL|nr:hypothetical protein [Brachyspira pilosicoli]TXJ43800.1 hypothetical protein EPJ72_03970 [Brachyspira pilosicoli]